MAGACGLLLCWQESSASAQDGRAQYPRFLAHSYIGLNIGYIDYPVSNSQMEPGFKVDSIRAPHLPERY